MATADESYTTTVLDDGIKKSRGDYGVRVARPGYDALTCTDSNLLFNSNWPIIQITKIIDFEDAEEYRTYYSYSTGKATSTKPDGITTEPTFSSADEYYVGSEYAYHLVGVGGVTDSDQNYWTVYKIIREPHLMNATPMFFMSDWVSDISGKMILTNIDLSVDVEYPYTDSPTILMGEVKDYGIKSQSIFGENVDGLSSNAFSKLIYRVMTTEKSGTIMKDSSGTVVDSSLSWYPMGEDATSDELGDMMSRFEFYGYTEPNPAITEEKIYSFLPCKFVYDSTQTFFIGATTIAGGASATSKVMVVVRSPMVSPEYEERVIDE